MENGTLMVLFDGCDTRLVDPGGSFICVADGGMLHKLCELLANPELDRTELRVPVVFSDAVASSEGRLGEYESVEPKLWRDLTASDSEMDGKCPITLGRWNLAFHGEVDRLVPSDFSGVLGDGVLNVGKLDPLVWLPVDALLIDGVNDTLQFLSGEEVLPNRPEVRPPLGGDLWFGSVPFGICFQRTETPYSDSNYSWKLSCMLTCSSSSTKTKSEISCRRGGVRGVTGMRRRE